VIVKELQNLSLEVVALGVNLISVLFVLVLNQTNVALPEGAEFLAFTITASVTVLILSLKRFISETLAKHIRMYQLLSVIEDEDLRVIGIQYMDGAERKLLGLSRSIVTGSDESFLLLSRKLEKATTIVLATNVAYTLDDLMSWKNKRRAKNYYSTNVGAIRRGVRIERMFLLRRNNFWNDEKQQLDPRAQEVIKSHKEDGVDVYVVWHQEIQRQEIEDFVIVDGRMVYVSNVDTVLQEDDWSGEISYDESTRRIYTERFHKFKRVAIDLKL
jgi:hypothetical protein